MQFQHGHLDAAMGPGADPAMLTLASNAGILPTAEFQAAFGEIKRAYALAGKPDAVNLTIHEGKHQVNNASAYRWLCEPLHITVQAGPADLPTSRAASPSQPVR